MLTAATGKTRIAFTSEQRRRLAIAGKALTAEEREVCCQIVRPSTILAWFRQLAAQKYDSSKKRTKPGRPRKANELRKLVLRLANENHGWGYTKIRDALRGLQVEIGRTTVAKILSEAGIEPAPERTGKRTWKQFLRNHLQTLYACDFFAVETLSPFGTVRYMAFFVFTKEWTALLEAADVDCVPIPARSPNCNQFVILGEPHLRYLLREFVAHYHTERYHQGLDGRIIAPTLSASNDDTTPRPGPIRCRSRLGGLLNYYHRHAA